MFIQKLSQVDNDFVVTIPEEEVKRWNLQEGDMVGIEILKVDAKPKMLPAVKAAFERSWKAYQADYRYLADK